MGTASIVGVVTVDEPNGRPLRRVQVTLNRAGGPTFGRMTTTDDQGRFVFDKLPAGNYSALRAARPGFVEAAYGQKRTGGPGVPISVADGQRVSVAIKMLRGGVIAGMISDQDGQPAIQVQVQAVPIRIVNGERQRGAGGFGAGGTTDDRGMYRLYGLAPGDFLVTVSPRFTTSGAELHPMTADEVRWADAQLSPRGAGVPGAPAPGGSPPPRPGQAVAYAPVFYPGTTDAAAATPVTVAAGQEVSGIDMRVGFVPTAKIEGTIVDPDGQPAQNVQMNIIPKADTSVAMMGPGMMFQIFGMRPQVSAGKFTIAALQPGDYMISTRAAPRGGGPPPMTPTARGAMPALSLWALTDISVNGADQSDVVVQLQPGMTLSGRIKFEGEMLQPPADLSRVGLRLMTAPNPSGVTITINPASAEVSADGSFTFAGVTPGKYLLTASAPSANAVPGVTWQLKSATIDRVDAADAAFEIKPGQSVGDAQVTFTDKMAEVSGTLLDVSGKPTSDFSVILFSTDKSFWWQRSRRLKAPTRAGTDGRFKFTNLPPGEYYVAALTDFEQSQVADPSFLEQVAASGAIKITLTDGEKKVQDLRLAGGS